MIEIFSSSEISKASSLSGVSIENFYDLGQLTQDLQGIYCTSYVCKDN